MTISGAHARPPEKTLQWEVAAATLLDRGDPAQGVEEVTVTRGAEEEAPEAGYDFVTLRCDGRDVENWPQATGWTV